jgi:hypothetical protein
VAALLRCSARLLYATIRTVCAGDIAVVGTVGT